MERIMQETFMLTLLGIVGATYAVYLVVKSIFE